MKRREVLSLAARWAAVGAVAPWVGACAAPTTHLSRAAVGTDRPPLLFGPGEPLPWDVLENVYFVHSGVHLAPARFNHADWGKVPGAPMVDVEDGAQVDVLALASIPWGPLLPGVLGPLEARLRDRNFNTAGVDTDILRAFTLDGHVVGVPFTAVPLVIYYDPQPFAATGVPLPRPGWAFEDLLQTCGLLKAALPHTVAVVDEESMLRTRVWAALVAARHGGTIADGSGELLDWDAEVQHGLSDYAALRAFVGPGAIRAGAPPAQDAGLGTALWFAPFHAGDWPAVRSGQVGIAAFPSPSGSRCLPVFPMGFGVGTKATDPGAALDFIQWMISAEGQRFTSSLGWAPVRDTLVAGDGWMPVRPGLTCDPAAFTAPSGQRWWPPVALWSQLTSLAADAIGNVSPQASASELKGFWEDLRRVVAHWRMASPLVRGGGTSVDFRPLSAIASGN